MEEKVCSNNDKDGLLVDIYFPQFSQHLQRGFCLSIDIVHFLFLILLWPT